MELEIENAVAWSEAIFGRCDLGDKRLTGRLVKIGSQLSKSQGASLAKSCEGESASIEGSYRFIRNDRVSAKQIAEGGYTATALLAQTIPVVELEIMGKQVTFMPAERSSKKLANDLRPITLNVVIAREKNPLDTEKALEWMLLTTEPITSFEEIRRITRYYELRWRIEDFHKAWKSGVGAEKQRMQLPNNLEKMVVILSFLAIRLLQLKEYLEPSSLVLEEDAVSTPCNELLTEIEWKILWKTIEKKELPSKTPTVQWAYQAIAKLGGWSNSKRTGKASWATLWDGWFRLTERVEGFLLAQSLGVA